MSQLHNCRCSEMDADVGSNDNYVIFSLQVSDNQHEDKIEILNQWRFIHQIIKLKTVVANNTEYARKS